MLLLWALEVTLEFQLLAEWLERSRTNRAQIFLLPSDDKFSTEKGVNERYFRINSNYITDEILGASCDSRFHSHLFESAKSTVPDCGYCAFRYKS